MPGIETIWRSSGNFTCVSIVNQICLLAITNCNANSFVNFSSSKALATQRKTDHEVMDAQLNFQSATEYIPPLIKHVCCNAPPDNLEVGCFQHLDLIVFSFVFWSSIFYRINLICSSTSKLHDRNSLALDETIFYYPHSRKIAIWKYFNWSDEMPN